MLGSSIRHTGGPITFVFHDVAAGTTTIDAVATIHGSRDSTAGLISGHACTTQLYLPSSSRYSAALHNLIITGAGAFAAQLDPTLTSVDASGVDDLTLSYAVGATSTFAASASNPFRFSNGVYILTVAFSSVGGALALRASFDVERGAPGLHPA